MVTLEHYPQGNSVHVERSHVGSGSHIRMLMVGGADMTQSQRFVGETNEQHWAPVASEVKRKQFQDFHVVTGGVGCGGGGHFEICESKSYQTSQRLIKLENASAAKDFRWKRTNNQWMTHNSHQEHVFCACTHAHTQKHTLWDSAVCLSAPLKFGNHATVLARPINNSVRSITWEENKSSGGCLKFSFSHLQLLLIGTRREITGLWRMFSKDTVFEHSKALQQPGGDNCFSFSSLQLHLSPGNVWFGHIFQPRRSRQEGRL